MRTWGSYVAERAVVVPGGRGLHARPAMAAWRAAKRYRSEVRIEGRGWSLHLNTADPSTLPYRLGVLQGKNHDRSGRVTVRAEGLDADEALAAVVRELEARAYSHPETRTEIYRRWLRPRLGEG